MTIHERKLPSSSELEMRRNIGVGSLILNMDCRIYTVRELKRNQDTERLPGQVSISTEKSKIGENLWSNLLGVLGEYCSDKDIPVLREHLFVVGSPRVMPVQLDGKPLACSLITLVCDIDIQTTPVHIEEVSPHGWISLPDALALPDLRPLSKQILTIVDRERLVEEGIRSYRNGVSKTAVFADFGTSNSFERFVQRRNLLPDSYENRNDTNGVK